MAEAVIVRGSSGDSGRDEAGSGIGDGDGEADGRSGNSMFAVNLTDDLGEQRDCWCSLLTSKGWAPRVRKAAGRGKGGVHL